MSRGGAGPGWGWWPPSRRRRLPRPGRRRAGGALLTAEAERSLPDWALPLAAAGSALLLLVAVLSGLAAALGLCGTALALAGAAAAAGGGAWAAAGGGRERRGPPPPPGKRALMPPPPAPALATACNGGPAASCASAGPEGRRRRICGDHLSSPVHFMLPPRRRYPIQQAQYASLGTLPSICWDGYGRKSRLSAHNSSMVQSPVTVKIARPDSNFGHSPLLEHLSSPAAFPPTPNSILDPCAKETVLSALRESRKRVVEEEEEDRSFLGGQEIKRRRHDSGGSGQSAFEPLVANGAPASLVPKPGSLKRGLLPSHGLEDSASKRSRTSSLSSVNSLSVGGIPSSIRNAIASSYSSTRGLSQLWKRSGLSGSPLSSPASSRSQTPERPNKKARYPNSSLLEEDSHKTSSSTPLKADKEVQAEKEAETPLQSRPSPSPWASLSSSGSNGKRKRKIQLLATRRGDHFTLPPPPQLGYPVTSEDLEAEKVAALQRFNKVLEDKTDSASSPPAEAVAASASSSLPSSLSFPLAQLAKPPTTAPEANPLLESLKKMQEGQSTSGQPDPGTAASTSSRETPQLPVASAPLSLGSLAPVTSADGAAKPLLLISPPSLTGAAASPLPPLPPPASSAAQPANEGSSLVTLSASSSAELSQTPARPSSSLPKPSILFGILMSPPGSQPLAAPPATMTAASSVPSTTAAAATAPVFKPIFGTPAKSEGLTLSSAGSASGTFSVTPPGTLPSGAPPSLDSSPGTFKRVFGGLPTPTTTAAAASSLFAFQPASAPGPPASTTTTTTAAGLSVLGFPAPSEGAGVSTLASLLSTAAGVTTVSASKSLFTFGLGSQTPTLGISGDSLAAPSATVPPGTAASTALPSQPLLFGAPSTTTTTTSTTSAPLFQFGKLASTRSPSLGPLASSTFSQATSNAVQGAPTSTSAAAAAAGFNIFGGGSGSSTRALTASSVVATTTMPATAAATAATTASQPSLTFGSGPSAFGGGFGAASKAPPPPYTAEPNQLTFEAGPPEGQQAAAKPTPGPVSFGTPFSFTGSVVQPAVQPAFGAGASSGGSQPTFGGPGPLVSFGVKSTSQPAFGATTSVFSFGGGSAAASGGFGSNTQTTASGSGGGTGGTSVFGGPAPAPFTFGASSQPAAAGGGGSAFALGAGAGAAGTGVPSVSFSFGSGQSGAAGAATPFGSSSMVPNPLGSPAQTSAFAFSIPGAPESKPAFGGAPTPTFGQSTPAAAAAAGAATLGASTLSFGSSITPAFGGTGPTFGPSAPTFSIGAGSKTGARQRLQARRQHTRKK